MKINRSILIMPGNNPGMLQNCSIFDADAVIFDLEDAVIPQEKDAARLLVANALRHNGGGKAEIMVRINPLDTCGKEDIRAVVPYGPAMLVVPKVEKETEITDIVRLVKDCEKTGQNPISLTAVLETPLGLFAAAAIGMADRRVAALSLGGEDYATVLGARRTKEGQELFVARSLIVNAAAAAGIYAIDTPFTDSNDPEGLEKDALLARQLGFKGKIAINPRQVEIINRIFTPDPLEIEWARRVLLAMEKAQQEGAGVASLDGKMIDKPVAVRARQVLQAVGDIEQGKEGVL